MRKVIKVTLAAVAASAISAPVAAAATGSLAPGPTSGKIEIFATTGSGPTAKIIVTGVIGDYGTATTVTAAGVPNENGDYVIIKLTKGTFWVNSVAFNKATNNLPPSMLNTKTCSLVFSAKGTVTLFKGTGAYVDMKGSVLINETFAGIGPMIASGPKKGSCNMSNSAVPVAQFGTIVGAGTVSFGM
jgi:hypothetical protein